MTQNLQRRWIWLTMVWALFAAGCDSGGSGGGSGGSSAGGATTSPSPAKGTHISGYVRNASGQGIKGVTVKDFLDAPVPPPFPEASAETNSDGYYVLIDPNTAGTRQIRCSRSNYTISPAKQVIDLKGGDQSGINFTGSLTAGGAIFENLVSNPLPTAVSYQGVAMIRHMGGSYVLSVNSYAESLGFSYLTFNTDGTFEALVASQDILALYYPSGITDTEFHESFFVKGIYAYEGDVLIADGYSADENRTRMSFVLNVNPSLEVTNGRFYDGFDSVPTEDDWLYFVFEKRPVVTEPLVVLQVIQRGGSGGGNLVPNARVSLYFDHVTYSPDTGNTVVATLYAGTAVTDANGIARFGSIGDVPSHPYDGYGYRLYAKIEADNYQPWSDYRNLGEIYCSRTRYVATRLDWHW